MATIRELLAVGELVFEGVSALQPVGFWSGWRLGFLGMKDISSAMSFKKGNTGIAYMGIVLFPMASMFIEKLN